MHLLDVIHCGDASRFSAAPCERRGKSSNRSSSWWFVEENRTKVSCCKVLRHNIFGVPLVETLREDMHFQIEERIKQLLGSELKVNASVIATSTSRTPLLGRGVGLDSVETMALVLAASRRSLESLCPILI